MFFTSHTLSIKLFLIHQLLSLLIIFFHFSFSSNNSQQVSHDMHSILKKRTQQDIPQLSMNYSNITISNSTLLLLGVHKKQNIWQFSFTLTERRTRIHTFPQLGTYSICDKLQPSPELALPTAGIEYVSGQDFSQACFLLYYIRKVYAGL